MKYIKRVAIDFDLNIANSIFGVLLFFEDEEFQRRILSTELLSLDSNINSNFSDYRLKTLYSAIILLAKTIKNQSSITSRELISCINANFDNDEDAEILEEEFSICSDKQENEELDMNFILNYVRNRRNYIGIFTHKDELSDFLQRIEVGDFNGNLEEFVSSFCETLDSTRKSLLPSLSEDRASDFILGVSTDKHRVEDVFKKAISKANDTTNILKLGLQYLNLQLGEARGLELGREYLFGGASGSGKSLFLLRIAYWIWKYNPIKLDPETGKRNLVIYASGENSQYETSKRIYEMFFPEDYVKANPFKNQTSEEVMELFYQEGFNDDNSFALAFIYRRNKSINTRDLEAIIEDYEEMGFRVKAVIFDYTKRINPVEKRNDQRLDLGAVVDEFATLAKTKNTALISAVQLNGEAIAALEEAAKTGEVNLLDKLGSRAIGESKLIIENTDFLFLIYIELSFVMKRSFQSIKLLKSRDKRLPEAPIFFSQPFSNWMETPHLLDDVDLEKPLGLLNINEAIDDIIISEAARPESKLDSTLFEDRRNIDAKNGIKRFLRKARKDANEARLNLDSEEDL